MFNVTKIFAPSKRCSLFYNCLIPFLDALGWQGEKRFIHEAIPLNGEKDMGEEDLLTSMANLGYSRIEFASKIKNIYPESMPCFFIDEYNDPYVLIHHGEDSVFAYSGKKCKYLEITDIDQDGKVLCFSETHKTTITLQNRQANWFTNLVARFKISFISFLIISFILTMLTLFSPLFIMFVYDQIQHTDSTDSLIMLGWAVVIYLLAFGGATFLQGSITRLSSIRLGNIVSNQVIRRILYLPLSFTEIASLGSQLARIKDFLSIQTFFGGSAFTSMCEVPFILILLLVLYFLGGNIVIVPIVAIVIFAISYFIMTYFVAKINSSMAGAGSERQELLLEILTNFRAIKFSGKRKIWQERFKELSADLAFQKFRDARVNSLISVYSGLLVSVAALLTIYLGVLKVMEGEMTPGSFMAVMILIWRVLGPIKNGFSVLSQTSSLKKSIKQLNRLMSMQLEVSDDNKATTTRKIEGKIDISQLSLRYMPDAEPALLGIDAAISKGETLVICGHGGSGKSTLLKLITGQYNLQAGRITIDDINVRQIPSVLLRKSITLIPQRTQLFLGTIENNLKAFHPAATIEEMEKALATVGLKKEIDKMPDGLQTIISEKNKKHYSDSFKKLLFIAAGILRDSTLIIIDEGTKGFNKEDFKRVIDIFTEMKKTKTLIFVTDQRPLFELADKVLWLDEGKIRKFGASEEVINEYFEIGEVV